MHELIIGGQRSGKSRCAEQRAAAWLGAPLPWATRYRLPRAVPPTEAARSAVLLATARAGDEEMLRRIAHHRIERAERVPNLDTEDVPIELAQAVFRHSTPNRLVVIDCLTLWLTNLLMPLDGRALDDHEWQAMRAAFCGAISTASGPLLLVSNEIGLGLSPMSPEARRFVDELGRLHQAVAARCTKVTMMIAGVELPVKSERR